MAKGVEDTTFYRYNRFVALNEVGGNAGAWTLPVDAFHLANIERAERFPRQLLTTFTHDTKRSPDVRARLLALTWHVDEWAELARRELDFADANEAYFALQTLVGAWPIEHERIDAYFEKAFRESKIRTNWLAPDEEWEGRIKAWARSKRDVAGALAERIRAEGERISLSMLVLKLTCPGVPDIYQGDEAEALALVDPDNRRPVDWGRLALLLGPVASGTGPPSRSCASRRDSSTCVVRIPPLLPAATCRSRPRPTCARSCAGRTCSSSCRSRRPRCPRWTFRATGATFSTSAFRFACISTGRV